MTDEQIRAMFDEMCLVGNSTVVQFARAILASHAIDGLSAEQEPIGYVSSGVVAELRNGPRKWAKLFSVQATGIPGNMEPVFAALNAPASMSAEPSDYQALLDDVTAIDTWHRGYPPYEHDANWLKDRVVRLIEERIGMHAEKRGEGAFTRESVALMMCDFAAQAAKKGVNWGLDDALRFIDAAQMKQAVEQVKAENRGDEPHIDTKRLLHLAYVADIIPDKRAVAFYKAIKAEHAAIKAKGAQRD